jgi:gliding motility-associated-like protein
MARVFLCITFSVMILLEALGQCVNPPTVTLNNTSVNTCGLTAISVTGNTFGGSATAVTITGNGKGSIIPASANTSPFSFTYTPIRQDVGKTVTITVTTNNPNGPPCSTAKATCKISINAYPAAPTVGTITQPTCSVATGSVILNGLPATGSWTLTRIPGGVTTTGTGTTATVSGLGTGTYTFTVTLATCTSAASANVVISSHSSAPAAPVVGTIIQPNCTVSTGSIILNGLPSAGTWTLTRSPGGVITTGTGTTIAISNLTEGTYSYTVTNSSGCMSPSSINIIILPQPSIPASPQIGTITSPTCLLPAGSVALSGLPATGTWIVTQYPGTITSSGSGTTTVITGLSSGVYNFTVGNAAGCVSSMSANVTIPTQPFVPSPPLIGTITQPQGQQQTGSVVINGLPENGNWTLTIDPGTTKVIGSGSTNTIVGLIQGTYSLTVTNSLGCTSVPSASFEITLVTDTNVIVINNPLPVCSPSKVDITSQNITSGSSSGLIFTYWNDAACTIPFLTPTAASAGIYYIKGTAANGISAIKPVTVTVYNIPLSKAGTDQVLAYKFETTLDAQIVQNYETGLWSLISGTGELSDITNPKTPVAGLSKGTNVFLWTVTNGVCPAASDTINILVHGLAYQTLITPNMDGKNDYFILRGPDTQGKLGLIIFDRRGALVYKNGNYDNTWNGIDYNGRMLPEDTYFYILRTDNGSTEKGYVVIKR